jgi:hypothetical protein
MVFNIIIIHHSSNDSGLADQISDFFKQAALDVNDVKLDHAESEPSVPLLLLVKPMEVHLMNESTPERLSSRADFIRNASLVIACLDRSFQRCTALLELVHFIRELKKPFYALNANRIGSYVPFGALGAIVCSTDLALINVEDTDDMSGIADKIMSNYEEKVLSNSDPKALMDMQPVMDPSRVPSAHIDIKFSQTEAEILISYHSEESREAVDLISSTLKSKGISHECEQTDLVAMANGPGTKVKNARLIILVMSKSYEENYICRTAIETARKLSKRIIPISTSREFKPKHWLALFLAGRLFFRIMNKEQAFKRKHEWHYSQMDSLVDEIQLALSGRQFNESDAEAKLIESLNKQVEECATELGHWPPKSLSNRKYANNIVRKPVYTEIKEVICEKKKCNNS